MPFKSSEGRTGGKLSKSNLTDNIGGFFLKSAANSQYFYGPDTETSLFVEPGIKSIVIAGVAPGGDCAPAAGDSTNGYGGAGGGAGNIFGVTINAVPLWNQNIYVKVPASPGSPVYVRTGSQSGTSIWEAGHGASTNNLYAADGGEMITGFGYAGGAGGAGFPGTGNGTSVNGAGSGGGGGGGHNRPTSEDDGYSGGTTTVPSNYLKPLSVGPSPDWTMQPGPGGAGGTAEQDPGDQAQYFGAEGGAAGNSWPNPNAGGGGGGGGIVVSTPNGLKSYGGGGGGKGADHGSGEYPGPQEGAGAGGFLIVQFVKHGHG